MQSKKKKKAIKDTYTGKVCLLQTLHGTLDNLGLARRATNDYFTFHQFEKDYQVDTFNYCEDEPANTKII